MATPLADSAAAHVTGPGLDATASSKGAANPATATDPDGVPLDLRLLGPACAAWAGALAGTSLAPRVTVVLGLLLVISTFSVLLAPRWRNRQRPDGRGPRRPAPGRWRGVVLAAVLCASAAAAAGAARVASLDRGPVARLADATAVVRAEGMVASDPASRPTERRFGPPELAVLVRLRLEEVTGRGRTWSVRAPVLVVGGEEWLSVTPGQRVRVSGRLGPADPRRGLSAFLRAGTPPTLIGRSSVFHGWTEPLREGLRRSVDDLPDGPRGLVPALVVGDESRLPDQLTEDMRTAGLLHLNAVSGANVAIVMGAVLGLGRRLGVRAYGLPLFGGVAVLAFVVVARPQPSVLRAAVMGLVILVALSSGGRRRGLASLCLAVLVLCLVDPFLGRSAGFALSVVATGGILVLAPGWAAAASWLPGPFAQALAVPLAAQLACTPLVIALSGELSLVGLPANLLVAPAVAPATLAGAAAAVVSPWWGDGGTLLGHLAGAPGWWIVEVSHAAARLPGATRAVDGTGVWDVLGLVVATVAAVLLVRPVLRRRWLTLVLAAVMVAAVVRSPAWGRVLPGTAWPHPDWSLAACDVGQGDGLALRAGPDSAVVVDAGPDPGPMDRCLRALGVRSVPLLVLTHFHADHVAGVPGVVSGRRVERVLVSPLPDPPEQHDDVLAWSAAAGAEVAVAEPGTSGWVGEVSWEVLWPTRLLPASESPTNDASVVLRVEVAGLSMLLTGDIEPPAQRAIVSSGVEIEADVLKVPHHGSANQDASFLDLVDPSLALVSSGADNTYGHPARVTVRTLERGGAVVLRTDRQGSLSIVRDEAGVAVLSERDP